ncbi:hypothetical protein [Spirosoma montaniterrae]|uniref:Glutamine cyclotransferase n=1 Tax=Spirosoma montaniterrae TaxID=1178516 RepID=A0A1P9WRD3_9BACT|nr:hypothetical protein [Spirosoma montaniterrae]AQG77932.1 hypothetical protein AWR27_00330 [Spirosoma montaniterrae]
MKEPLLLALGLGSLLAFYQSDVALTLTNSTTIDSLGACQGVSYIQGKAYLYGDREVGMIRTYTPTANALTYTGREIRLTENGKDVINHPTGIAWNGADPTFIGNSIRLNPEGTKWRAVIYNVNWDELLRTGTLDGNLLNTIEDDACIQGTRPEYVYYQNKWYVATADYGNRANEVRLYDPSRLATAKKTSEPGILVKKFTCSPWVQNLHWIPSKGILVLIQNQIEGRRWRFTFVDLAKSIEAGHEQVIKTIDLDNADELEGFALLDNTSAGLTVTSSRRDNVHFVSLNW